MNTWCIPSIPDLFQVWTFASRRTWSRLAPLIKLSKSGPTALQWASSSRSMSNSKTMPFVWLSIQLASKLLLVSTTESGWWMCLQTLSSSTRTSRSNSAERLSSVMEVTSSPACMSTSSMYTTSTRLRTPSTTHSSPMAAQSDPLRGSQTTQALCHRPLTPRFTIRRSTPRRTRLTRFGDWQCLT